MKKISYDQNRAKYVVSWHTFVLFTIGLSSQSILTLKEDGYSTIKLSISGKDNIVLAIAYSDTDRTLIDRDLIPSRLSLYLLYKSHKLAGTTGEIYALDSIFFFTKRLH